MEDLKDIIKEIKKYRTELGIPNLSDDMIVYCSSIIFNSKKINSQNIGQSKKEDNVREPITKEQEKTLKKMNKYKEGLSKNEAYWIIRNNSKQKNNQINKKGKQ